MSDDYIKLVPKDPFLRPSDSSLTQVADWMEQLSLSLEAIEISSDPKPQFHDAGSNWETTYCPVCRKEIQTDWWQDRMEEDYDGEGFKLASYATPCCGTLLTLNDLDYDMDQAFGVATVVGQNLNLGHLSSEQIKDAERLMGTPLTIVYCHL
jgi:hypothetical protein